MQTELVSNRGETPIRMSREHKDLLIKWVDGEATADEIKQCQRLDREMEIKIYGEPLNETRMWGI